MTVKTSNKKSKTNVIWILTCICYNFFILPCLTSMIDHVLTRHINSKYNVNSEHHLALQPFKCANLVTFSKQMSGKILLNITIFCSQLQIVKSYCLSSFILVTDGYTILKWQYRHVCKLLCTQVDHFINSDDLSAALRVLVLT